jgi:hypothetical protein
MDMQRVLDKIAWSIVYGMILAGVLAVIGLVVIFGWHVYNTTGIRDVLLAVVIVCCSWAFCRVVGFADNGLRIMVCG